MSSTGGRRAERKRDFDMEMEEFKNVCHCLKMNSIDNIVYDGKN